MRMVYRGFREAPTPKVDIQLSQHLNSLAPQLLSSQLLRPGVKEGALVEDSSVLRSSNADIKVSQLLNSSTDQLLSSLAPQLLRPGLKEGAQVEDRERFPLYSWVVGKDSTFRRQVLQMCFYQVILLVLLLLLHEFVLLLLFMSYLPPAPHYAPRLQGKVQTLKTRSIFNNNVRS